MMKKAVFALLLAIVGAGFVKADNLTGTVVDENGSPVEFATVVALADSLQRGVAVTDSTGRYRMELPARRYRVVFSMVGYTKVEKEVDVAGTVSLDAVMTASGVVMADVEVRASAIRREPDRFVMIVEDMPSAVGKDGKELLREAPGVWIDDENVSINGKSGVKIYVNERELKMDTDQLLSFLQSLKAEDVSKVEIVPLTGVEYSADTSAGVIKITMKKNRADGVMGNVGVSTSVGGDVVGVNPSAAVHVKKGKWSFSLNGFVSVMPRLRREMEERNDYADGAVYATQTLINADKALSGNVLAGVFFDPDAANSFGLELGGNMFKNPSRTATDATFDRIARQEKLSGGYLTHARDVNFDATFNWLHRMDTLGSTMKAIAGYTRSAGRQRMDNRVLSWELPEAVTLKDSLSRSREHSVYDVLNVSYDFDKKFSRKWNLSAGAKYTLNRMNNDASYEYRKDGQWVPAYDRNYDEVYTENIYALYAKVSARFGRVSAVAGLRGELTDGDSRGGAVEQNYFDLFPNAHVSWLFDEMGANSLTATYSRSVARPSFWALNPIRRQSSDYFYQVGNPDLKPAYTNHFSLTGVLKYRYSVSLWTEVYKDQMIQGTMADLQNPDNILLSMVNIDRQYMFGAAVSVPFQLAKWWTLNVNPIYIYKGEKMSAEADTDYSGMFFLSANTGITLPKDFYFNVAYFFRSRVRQGEMKVGAMNLLNVSLKKSFAQKRWTVSVGADNLLSSRIKMSVVSDAYHSRTDVKMPVSFNASVTYNFNVGKMFQAKKIEKNSDASRLSKDDGMGK